MVDRVSPHENLAPSGGSSLMCSQMYTAKPWWVLRRHLEVHGRWGMRASQYLLELGVRSITHKL